jgi:four helix bundle protein
VSKHASLSSDLLRCSKQFVMSCYAITSEFPGEEKTNLFRYIRTAGLLTHINIVQALSVKKKKKRKVFIREARQGLIVVNAALDVLVEAGFTPEGDVQPLKEQVRRCYELLDKLKKRQVMRIVAIDGRPALHTERQLGL